MDLTGYGYTMAAPGRKSHSSAFQNDQAPTPDDIANGSIQGVSDVFLMNVIFEIALIKLEKEGL